MLAVFVAVFVDVLLVVFVAVVVAAALYVGCLCRRAFWLSFWLANQRGSVAERGQGE